MSIESGIHDKIEIEYSINRPTFCRAEFTPYLLPTVDAFIIVLSCVASGVGYHLLIGGPIPEILPLCAVGSLASFIYISRMSGSGYYELQEGAKPRLELREILVCWFTTGLLLCTYCISSQDWSDLFSRCVCRILPSLAYRIAGCTQECKDRSGESCSSGRDWRSRHCFDG
jgi:hypothetical protein